MENKFVEKVMKKITGILDILICLLLFISAMYKGGFYKENSLFVSMIICMLGLICLSVKIVINIRDNRKITKSKLETLVDMCVMVLPIAYFLPIVFGKAASRESAIFETIRYVNFAIIYFIVRTTNNKKTYLTCIVLIGIVLAVLGIDELTYRAIGKLLEPLSITYLSERSGKLSSTLQYANITGLVMLIASIIVQGKLVQNMPNLKKESTIKFKILIILEIFSLVMLQSAIILTTSRMNVLLMILTTIIYSIYCIKLGRKRSGLMLCLLLIAAFSLVTSIDSYMRVQNNFMICMTYVITLVIITLLVLLSTKFYVVAKIDKNTLKQNPKIIILGSILFLAVLLVILLTPNELRVSDTTKEGTMVTRNIYTKLQSTMDLEVMFDFKTNSSFIFEMYEIDENFNKKMVVSITEKSVINGVYNEQIKLSDTAENLMITFKTIDSDISIKSLKLNGKRITLSYMFIPDSLMFRLKDTLIKDSNNTLRFTYYKDALKLFNKSKLFGMGGEGFKSRYQEVQDTYYISSETHSAPLQILVESGIIGFSAFGIICIAICVLVIRLCKDKNEDAILYALIVISYITLATFDLVFSFGIMIYIFAVILGLIISEYKINNTYLKDRYEFDNKSVLGMIKIGLLSLSLMSLFFVTIYSVNIYRASMIVLPNKSDVETTTDELDLSYKRVGLLESKVALDKYNIEYLNSLILEYDKHIDLLNDIYLSIKDENEKFLLKIEINNYIVRQKELADNVIEYEYYNKYALDTVARCYFKRYISYANIFNENFKNDEIAYVFYIGYGIKLTDRITEVSKVNKLAHTMAYNIYDEYLTVLKTENKLLNSPMLAKAIENMEQKKLALEEKI